MSANAGKYVMGAFLSYAISTYVSYKYSQVTKAQADLKGIKD
jgi:hypothetical protein